VHHWYTQSHANAKGDGTAVTAIIDYLTTLPRGEKVTMVITGPCTNIAAVRLAQPELYDDKIDEVVVMGGALDIPQWTPHAEFNIAVDPDALDELTKSSKVRVVLVPLNVTHKAIFGREVHARLLDP
jgi:inosine-uridine nucleoside N-ribohydrolase